MKVVRRTISRVQDKKVLFYRNAARDRKKCQVTRNKEREGKNSRLLLFLSPSFICLPLLFFYATRVKRAYDKDRCKVEKRAFIIRDAATNSISSNNRNKPLDFLDPYFHLNFFYTLAH